MRKKTLWGWRGGREKWKISGLFSPSAHFRVVRQVFPASNWADIIHN
ncbi:MULTISPECIES: hypothetical protein [Edwardsiella]|uniref:Uncharacterized protein n=2 Tax=Edwardsiella anguillarum TaxID=1821960 RepID=A0A076LSZ4_9GAMM|nr:MULTISPECIES: hypothetical protein [Edwardsiella]AIJ09638.1 Hypothetical protein ETEE_3212 [Edwardsiella anguillarum ET080813]UBU94946.1 hypothetical protein AAZ33_18835 [Edwardsiella sp. LADL05-105]UOU80421.1 hypothetical protein MUN71_07520 [Edwardsiella anguillarum]WHP81475.1 hypothetical protein MQ090_06345 [Edwardsiella anguillarum]WHP85110.1 hypothetical protein MQ095_06680 [Edwardsiella anguillarum]